MTNAFQRKQLNRTLIIVYLSRSNEMLRHCNTSNESLFLQYLCSRPRERSSGGLHYESPSFDLTSLRNVLDQHQTLHNYPASLPGLTDCGHPLSTSNFVDKNQSAMSCSNFWDPSSSTSLTYVNGSYGNNNMFSEQYNNHQPQPPPTLDPLLLCAKISRNSDLLSGDMRPSQSLPGSPRKIRVAAMLPDVGNNSPDLR